MLLKSGAVADEQAATSTFILSKLIHPQRHLASPRATADKINNPNHSLYHLEGRSSSHYSQMCYFYWDRSLPPE